MTIKEAIKEAVIMMKNENIDAPKIKARMLLEATLKKSKEYLMIYDTKQITPAERDEYIKKVKRLILGEPLQYITGKQEFMKLNFLVTKDVLIPRQDTEILVQEVIDKAKNIKNPVILDLCTGSGVIAISLAKYVNNSKIIAVDVSPRALEVARKNAILNGVINNIEFVESDLFSELTNKKFDIIVSNPPYIETRNLKSLPRDVQSEPRLALDGGKDGLNFYRIIFENAFKFLNKQGFVCVEIGYNQKKSVLQIVQNQKRYFNYYSKRDLCENDRIVVAEIG